MDTMTLWEFQACLDGWRSANASEESKPIMDDDTAREYGVEGF